MSIADQFLFAAAMLVVFLVLYLRFGHAPKQLPPPSHPPVPPAPLHHYYGGHEITKAVEDVFAPIATVITAVEKQCEKEWRASQSYMRDRHRLLYPSHPWMTYVRTGSAEWLGWAKDFSDIGRENPADRYRGKQQYDIAAAYLKAVQRQQLNRPSEATSIVPLLVPGETETITTLDGTSRIIRIDPPASATSTTCAYCGQPEHPYDGTHRFHPRSENCHQHHLVVTRTVKITDPDTGEHLRDVKVCAYCGETAAP